MTMVPSIRPPLTTSSIHRVSQISSPTTAQPTQGGEDKHNHVNYDKNDKENNKNQANSNEGQYYLKSISKAPLKSNNTSSKKNTNSLELHRNGHRRTQNPFHIPSKENFPSFDAAFQRNVQRSSFLFPTNNNESFFDEDSIHLETTSNVVLLDTSISTALDNSHRHSPTHLDEIELNDTSLRCVERKQNKLLEGTVYSSPESEKAYASPCDDKSQDLHHNPFQGHSHSYLEQESDFFDSSRVECLITPEKNKTSSNEVTKITLNETQPYGDDDVTDEERNFRIQSHDASTSILPTCDPKSFVSLNDIHESPESFGPERKDIDLLRLLYQVHDIYESEQSDDYDRKGAKDEKKSSSKGHDDSFISYREPDLSLYEWKDMNTCSTATTTTFVSRTQIYRKQSSDETLCLDESVVILQGVSSPDEKLTPLKDSCEDSSNDNSRNDHHVLVEHWLMQGIYGKQNYSHEKNTSPGGISGFGVNMSAIISCNQEDDHCIDFVETNPLTSLSHGMATTSMSSTDGYEIFPSETDHYIDTSSTNANDYSESNSDHQTPFDTKREMRNLQAKYFKSHFGTIANLYNKAAIGKLHSSFGDMKEDVLECVQTSSSSLTTTFHNNNASNNSRDALDDSTKNHHLLPSRFEYKMVDPDFTPDKPRRFCFTDFLCSWKK